MYLLPFEGPRGAMRTAAGEILGAAEVPLAGGGEDAVVAGHRGGRGDVAGVRSHIEAGTEIGQV